MAATTAGPAQSGPNAPGASNAIPGAPAWTALSGWHARLFWRWQAWRLRRYTTTEQHGYGVGLYDGIAALDHLGYADAFMALHLSVSSGVPGFLPDGALAFRRRLTRELSGTCCAIMLGAPDGSLGGYCWGRVGQLPQALLHYQHVQSLGHLRADDWQTVERRASDLCGGGPVLALHGIGLANRWRKGFAPIKQLLKPLIDLAIANDSTRAIWWTPRSSPLHAISLGLGAHRIHQTSACAFFLLADTRPIARVFAALPASDIAALLARVAPARGPAARLATRDGRAPGKRDLAA